MKHRFKQSCLALVVTLTATPVLSTNNPLIPDDPAQPALPMPLMRTLDSPPPAQQSPKQPAPAYSPTNTEQESFGDLFLRANTYMHEKKVDEAITTYRRAIMVSDSVPEPHFNLGVALIAQGEKEKAAIAFKDAINRRDSYTKAHLLLGRTLCQLKRSDEAQAHFKKVTEQDPSEWEAHAAIGRWHISKERFDEGIDPLRQATERHPNDVQLHFEYANALNTVNRLDEALIEYKKILRRMPTSVAVLYNTAYTLKRLNKIEEAMGYYEKVIQQDPNHAEAQFSRGLARYMVGDWLSGWEGYEWRWKRGDNKPAAQRLISQPMWDGVESLSDKTILLASEQGYGDTFQFIRYAKMIKEMGAKRVLVYAQQRIKTICAQQPYIDEIVDLTPTLPKFDLWASLPSCPNILKSTIESVPRTLPYLHAREDLVQEWKEKLSSDTNFKIGICWQGNNNYQTAFLRAVVGTRPIQLEKLAPLGNIPGLSIYSLQRMDGTDQLKNLPQGFEVKTFGPEFDSKHGAFMDTAAVIKNLDLVITIDTSIAHLSAGLGARVWVLLPNPADWRWMFDRDDCPWYPGMQLFRQTQSGEWDDVVERVVRELSPIVKQFHTKNS